MSQTWTIPADGALKLAQGGVELNQGAISDAVALLADEEPPPRKVDLYRVIGSNPTQETNLPVKQLVAGLFVDLFSAVSKTAKWYEIVRT